MRGLHHLQSTFSWIYIFRNPCVARCGKAEINVAESLFPRSRVTGEELLKQSGTGEACAKHRGAQRKEEESEKPQTWLVLWARPLSSQRKSHSYFILRVIEEIKFGLIISESFMTLWNPYNELHFSVEGTEAQSSEVTHSRSHSWHMAKLGQRRSFDSCSFWDSPLPLQGREWQVPCAMHHLLLAPSLDQGPESAPLCHICSSLWLICGLWLNPVEGFSNTGCLASQWESWLISHNPGCSSSFP